MTIVRVHYGKGAALRFLGHLDMQRLWDRTLRRARLPVAFSEGFRPRPRLETGPPLSLGFTSAAELIDIRLREPLTPQRVRAALEPVLPPGLTIYSVSPVTPETPKLSTLATFTYTTVLPLPAAGFGAVDDARRETLAAESLPVVRQRKGRDKAFDLRPSLAEVQVGHHDDGVRVDITVRMRPNGTANPREVLGRFGLWDSATVREAVVERCAFTFGVKEGSHGHTTDTPYETKDFRSGH